MTTKSQADAFSLARHSRYDALKLLLVEGEADVGIRDPKGNTLLHVACQNGGRRIAKLLLREGANIDAVNAQGNTALHFCHMFGFGGTLGELLLQASADDTLRNKRGLTCYETTGSIVDQTVPTSRGSPSRPPSRSNTTASRNSSDDETHESPQAASPTPPSTSSFFTETLKNIGPLHATEQWHPPSKTNDAGPQRSRGSQKRRDRVSKKRPPRAVPATAETSVRTGARRWMITPALVFLLLCGALGFAFLRGRKRASHNGGAEHRGSPEEEPDEGLIIRGSSPYLSVAESEGFRGNLTILRVPKTGSSEIWKHRRIDGFLSRCTLVGHEPSLDKEYDVSQPTVAVARDVCDRFRSQFAHLKYKKKIGLARHVRTIDQFARILTKEYGQYKYDPERMAAQMRADQARLGGGHWIILAPFAAYLNENTALMPYNHHAPKRILDMCGDRGNYVNKQEATAQERRDRVTQKYSKPLSADACHLVRTELFPVDDALVNGKRTEDALMAAEQGDAAAQIKVGNMYRDGEGVTQSDAKAKEWFEKAAGQGDSEAQVTLGSFYELSEGMRNNEKAFELFKRAADQGNAQGQYLLGGFYARGKVVPQNDATAVELLAKAAAQGDPKAQYDLAGMYQSGRGVPRSDSKALALIKSAAQKGFDRAQYQLAMMYRDGRVVPKDGTKAVAWYKKAADQGYGRAQKHLKDAKGLEVSEVPQNTTAEEWFMQSADRVAPIGASFVVGGGGGASKDGRPHEGGAACPRGCPLHRAASKDCSSVAVVLRGTAFRQGITNGTECRHDERQRQIAAVELLLKNVVEPLEQLCDATVEIFAPAVAGPRANTAACQVLHEDLSKAFNRRIVATNVTKTRGQAESMRFAMNLFKREKLRSSVEDYALVVFVRYDFQFTRSVSDWKEANFRRFSFLSRCEPKATDPTGQPYLKCVNELLFTMPGPLFAAFDRAAGHHACFGAVSPGDGHGCYVPVSNEIRKVEGYFRTDVGFLSSWQPKRNVREESPIGYIWTNLTNGTLKGLVGAKGQTDGKQWKNQMYPTNIHRHEQKHHHSD